MNRKLIGLMGAAVVALSCVAGAAHAAVNNIQTFRFYGYFGGGSQAPFPLYPQTISGSITYDTSLTDPSNANYGFSAWYYNSITAFSFTSAGVGPLISGGYAGPGTGTFIVFNNNGGQLDALAPTIFAPDLTGTAPAGYTLESAGLYFTNVASTPGGPNLLTSADLPDVSTIKLGAFSGKLFDATFSGPGGPVTIYANITAVPELSTWAMLLLGFAGIGFFSYRSRPQPTIRMI